MCDHKDQLSHADMREYVDSKLSWFSFFHAHNELLLSIYYVEATVKEKIRGKNPHK